mgnify:CR=1 FL=1
MQFQLACSIEDQEAQEEVVDRYCHELVPVDFKNMWSGTSKPMRVIYGGLVACTLVYPLWCSVVFFLKNFTRCCGGAKYSWGM